MEARAGARRMTAEEYAAITENDERHELQAGVLLSEPRPFPRHGRIQAELAWELREFVGSRDLGVVLTDAGFLLSRNPDTVRGPDVAFVRRERYQRQSEAEWFFEGAPDL